MTYVIQDSYNPAIARRGLWGVNASPIELSVVLPVFNERCRLPAALAAFRAALEARPTRRWELMVVDDGSTDGTARLAEAVAGRDPRVRVLRCEVNRGKGHAVRVGVLASRGRRVLFSDADLPTPLGELARLESRLDGGGYAAAIGSRSPRDRARRSPIRRVPAWLGGLLIHAVAVRGYADTQCGFKLFDGDRARAAFAVARIDGWGFDVEILRLFAAFGWPVVEVPVRWRHRAGSKLRPGGYVRVLGEIAWIRLRYGPPPTPPPAPALVGDGAMRGVA